MKDRINKLFELSGDAVAFEAERSAIIEEMLASIPEKHREKCRALQSELDAARNKMNSDQFMQFLIMRVQENIADMLDQFRAIQAIAEKGSTDTPRLSVINKIALSTMKR